MGLEHWKKEQLVNRKQIIEIMKSLAIERANKMDKELKEIEEELRKRDI